MEKTITYNKFIQKVIFYLQFYNDSFYCMVI